MTWKNEATENLWLILSNENKFYKWLDNPVTSFNSHDPSSCRSYLNEYRIRKWCKKYVPREDLKIVYWPQILIEAILWREKKHMRSETKAKDVTKRIEENDITEAIWMYLYNSNEYYKWSQARAKQSGLTTISIKAWCESTRVRYQSIPAKYATDIKWDTINWVAILYRTTAKIGPIIDTINKESLQLWSWLKNDSLFRGFISPSSSKQNIRNWCLRHPLGVIPFNLANIDWDYIHTQCTERWPSGANVTGHDDMADAFRFSHQFNQRPESNPDVYNKIANDILTSLTSYPSKTKIHDETLLNVGREALFDACKKRDKLNPHKILKGNTDMSHMTYAKPRFQSRTFLGDICLEHCDEDTLVAHINDLQAKVDRMKGMGAAKDSTKVKKYIEYAEQDLASLITFLDEKK